MGSNKKMLRHIVIVSLILFLTACGSSPKTNFYVLNADLGAMTREANINKGPAVGVWRVKLPDILDRSEIVTRDSQFEIKLGDFSWWAGSLDKNMTQLIAAELSERLRSSLVVVSPWESYRKLDYQVVIRVERFDGVLGGEAVLRGVWGLLDAEGQKELQREAFAFKANTADSTYKEMVAAMSQLTVQLAGQVAKAILTQASL